MLIVSFAVFAITLFALAENTNTNTLFLDSDQDGLTDQEEHMIGTDPLKADTDGDGYSDGKEVGSGYNPLKPAPGDKIITGGIAGSASLPKTEAVGQEESTNAQVNPASDATGSSSTKDILSGAGIDSSSLSDSASSGITDETFSNLSSDPSDPNLTNEMLGQLMQLTKEKSSTSDGFLNNPSFTAEDYSQITQKALASTNIEQSLPEISDSEIKVLPPVDETKLSPEEVKARQKAEIEKYLASMAFVFASNSPFPVEQPENFQSSLNSESANFLTALTSGDSEKISAYAEKAQSSIDQIKQIEVPYVFKDLHKSTLQLALYTLNLKDKIVIDTNDPMKSLAAVSTLQTVASEAMKIQEAYSSTLKLYGIEFIKFP